MKKFLELLGVPTTNKRGHELGCMCNDCQADRDKALTMPPKPGTLGHLLLEISRALKRDKDKEN